MSRSKLRLRLRRRSANTINTNNIRVSLNGADISSSLAFGGSPSAVTVSYSGLPVNPTLINNSSLNGATLGIRVEDEDGGGTEE